MYFMEAKTTDAAWPRGPGSTLDPSDRLKIAYIKFKSKRSKGEKTQVNLIFAHGTGMNKSVWKQHIKQLFERNKDSKWHLGNVVAVDCVSHGDSAILNKGKLGWGFDWRDGGKDLVQVVKNEALTCGDFAPSPTTVNILVGHSFGGFHCTYAAYLEPALFSGCIAVEPVLYVEEQFREYFFHRMQKIHKLIRDTFDLMEEAIKYVQKDSFYRTLEPAVLRDYAADELYPSDGKVKTKASKEAQMSTYCSAFFSLSTDQDCIKYMRIPYLHLVGSDAEWNLPLTIEFVRESVPAPLLEMKEIQGTHLMFGENVGDTVDAIVAFTEKQVTFSEDHRKENPLVKFNGDREKIMKSMLPLVINGDYDRAFGYGWPNPKI